MSTDDGLLHLDPGLNLTVWEAKKIGLLGGLSPEATLNLAVMHLEGAKGIARDQNEAIALAKKAFIDLQRQNKALNTQKLYKGFQWYTSFRLMFLGASRLDAVSGHSAFQALRVNAPVSPLAIFGLSYGVECFWDGVMIFKAVFLPKTEQEKALGYWGRFKNIIHKGNRPARMRNAIVWIAVNLTALFVSAGLSIILNMTGFAFDVVHEVYKAALDYFRHKKLLKKIDARIEAIASIPNYQESPHYEQFERLVVAKQKLLGDSEGIKTAIKNGLFAVGIAIGMLIGIAMVFFPPTLPVALAGAIIIMLTISTGFSRRVWGFLSSFRKKTGPADYQSIPSEDDFHFVQRVVETEHSMAVQKPIEMRSLTRNSSISDSVVSRSLTPPPTDLNSPELAAVEMGSAIVIGEPKVAALVDFVSPPSRKGSPVIPRANSTPILSPPEFSLDSPAPETPKNNKSLSEKNTPMDKRFWTADTTRTTRETSPSQGGSESPSVGDKSAYNHNFRFNKILGNHETYAFHPAPKRHSNSNKS